VSGIGGVLKARIPQGGADVAWHLSGNLRQHPEPSAEIVAAEDVIQIEYGDFDGHADKSPTVTSSLTLT
jgi:hypothetical protein